MCDFNKYLSIYIPRVTSEWADEAMIMETFKNNNIGIVTRVDIVKKETYYQAFVHFQQWYDSQMTRNLQSRILDPNREARIVHDDPNYFLLLKNKNPMSEIEVRLEKRIMELEEKNKIHMQIEIAHLNRIMELETKFARLETHLWQEQNGYNHNLTPLWCHQDNNEQEIPEWYNGSLNYNCSMAEYASQTKEFDEPDELSMIENGDNVCDYYDYDPYDMDILE